MKYRYLALREGREEKGWLEARDLQAALQSLRDRGLIPIEVEPYRRKSLLPRRKLGEEEILLFTEQLSRLVKGGLPLDRALSFMEKILSATAGHRLVQLAGRLRSRLKEGQSLSGALAEEEDFPAFYVQLIRAGELSGQLPNILDSLEQYLRERQRFRSELISSLLYPSFLLFFGLIAVQTILVYILPRFASIFEDFGVSPPRFTLYLLKAGLFWRDYGAYVLLGLGGGVLVGLRWLRGEEQRLWLERRLIRMPWVGKVLVWAELARIFRAIGLMLKGGLSLPASFQQGARITTLHLMKEALEDMAERMRTGYPLRLVLLDLPQEASLVRDFLAVGEESGALPEACFQVAAVCEERFRTTVTRFLRGLEPATILFFGLFIGSIMATLLSAIFSVQP
ncbi:type II secretion system F family protein [Thermosulfurimonas sp. F29]|uniref:type II secretion system F family protein n=1 Tax=Thermosulfurimonas sp. F29 TaxID=2867247 RepID=UPI001C833FAB|nr:type II secretion system F family protein [Thermosulfurimonas sp. F29]MBX6424281.1 type II secretion system F family protein [Thermosulfurimonas sp. F29]